MQESFGLEAALLPPLLSAVVSVVLLGAMFRIGLWVQRLFGVSEADRAGWGLFAAPAMGAMVLVALLYPFALFGFVGAAGMRAAAQLLVLLGAWTALDGLLALRVIFARAETRRAVLRWQIAPYGLLLGLAIVALGPSTNADSLNYHLGVALHLLQVGTWPASPEWFHSRLAGSGESLVALGLSLGAEQFASLVQWSGILALSGLLLCCPGANSSVRTALALALVSAPVLLFLVSSAKPQLLPAGLTSIALALTLYPSADRNDRKLRLLRFALVCLLVMSASQMKLSFLVSGAVVGALAFALMARRGLGLQAGIIAALTFAAVMLPPAIWKHLMFGGSMSDAFVKPFPGAGPGYDGFVAYLRNYRDSPMWFPLSLLVPAGAGLVSTVIGIGVAAPAWLRPKRGSTSWLAIGAAVVVTVLGTLFGQASARFYLEPFVWILMALAMQSANSDQPVQIWTRRLLNLQALATALLVVYAAAAAIPALASRQARSALMSRQANGFAVMNWVATALPRDAVLVSAHTSVALAPRRVFASDWIQFTGPQPADWAPYLNRLMEGGATHALVIGEPAQSPFASCFSAVEAGPFNGTLATRNPFNAGAPYTAWLMKLDSTRLPSCFRK